ncbi:MAG: acylphosphatase [Treponema sp.]|nr:acylphosphatase [Treponema sp.]HAP54881.1 acylphosphatase [Spirochaetaceae bacterium]
MKAFHAFIEGEVQGVGFRYATLGRARLLGIQGWVRNTQDDEVEIWAQGEEGALASFLEWLHRGPVYAEVRNVRCTWREPRGDYSSFEIAF